MRSEMKRKLKLKRKALSRLSGSGEPFVLNNEDPPSLSSYMPHPYAIKSVLAISKN